MGTGSAPPYANPKKVVDIWPDKSSRGGLDRSRAIISFSRWYVLAIGGSNPAWGMYMVPYPLLLISI